MYCWRIKKKDFWPAMRELKQEGLHNHPVMDVVANMRRQIRSTLTTALKAQVQYEEDILRMFQADECGLLALQVFDEGRTWLVRPLYYGHNFGNVVEKLKLPFTVVYYDGRVGQGSRGGEDKADWVDEKVGSGQYFVHIILGSKEPFDAMVYGIWPRGFEPTRDSDV